MFLTPALHESWKSVPARPTSWQAFLHAPANPNGAYTNRYKSLRSLDSAPSATVLGRELGPNTAGNRISHTVKHASSSPSIRASTSGTL
jgi:hypothetical protein